MSLQWLRTALHVAAISAAYAQGECSLRSDPQICHADAGCEWCGKQFCAPKGECSRLAASAGPPLPTQYSCNISVLTIDPNDPRPDLESSTLQWDLKKQASAYLGTSGASDGMRTIARYDQKTEYIITTMGICEKAGALPMSISDPFAWVKVHATACARVRAHTPAPRRKRERESVALRHT